MNTSVFCLLLAVLYTVVSVGHSGSLTFVTYPATTTAVAVTLSPPPGPTPAVCELPKATIPCTGSKRTYFFNKDTRLCQLLNKGECPNNDNQFERKFDCITLCHLTNMAKRRKTLGWR